MRILPQFDPAKRPIVNPQRMVPPPQGSIQQNGNKRRFVGLCVAIGLILVLLWKATPLLAADDCLSCHGPETGMVNSKGKAITVNPGSLAHSVHKDLGCVDCHAGAAKSGHTAKTASA